MRVAELRNEIDKIDAKLVHLLNERARRAVEIGIEKKRDGASVHDRAREDQVLERVRDLNSGPLDNEAISRIYREIISACINAQESDESRRLQ